MQMKLTDYLNSINYSKIDLFKEDELVAKKGYSPFVINRCLSYFTDTILYVNEMNRYCDISEKMQYDYFRISIRKRKRFSKWIKYEINDDLSMIITHFNCSIRKAKEMLPLLTDDFLMALRDLNIQKT